MLKQSALIVIDTNLCGDALAYVCSAHAGKRIFVDTVSTAKAVRIAPYLDVIHTLKPSLIEAEALAGIAARTDKQLPKLANWFHERGVTRVFITLGERGVFYSTGDARGIERPGAGAPGLRNAGGAGDAFMAGLAYSWLKRWSLAKSLQFSLAAAAVTLSHGGTTDPGVSLAAVNRQVRRSHAS